MGRSADELRARAERALGTAAERERSGRPRETLALRRLAAMLLERAAAEEAAEATLLEARRAFYEALARAREAAGKANKDPGAPESAMDPS